jgi:D-alanyl-D-alanine carboxypeptidase/D-alanyl-D-alanine-endopeptidase (penicillin-binding protein 4)
MRPGTTRTAAYLLPLLACGVLLAPGAAHAAPDLPSHVHRAVAGRTAVVAERVATALKGIGATHVDYEFDIAGVGSVRHAANTSTAPASNEKIFTSIAALNLLGPTFRYRTTVGGTAPVTNGVLNGDLVLRATGDPTLTMNNLLRLAQKLHAKGLRQVTGRLWIDDRRYSRTTRVTGWKHSFVPDESGTVDAFSVDQNEWRRGAAFEADPTHANAAIWRKELKRAHIQVDGGTLIRHSPRTVLPLATHKSASLIAILDAMNHQSINFYAEMILRELGVKESSIGTPSAGVAAVKGVATKLGLPFGTAYDGSGLSYSDRQTPATIVKWLETQAPGSEFYYSLPLSCASGTLQYRLCGKNVAGRVRAKTGTINHVSTLSGYFETLSGHWVMFSVLVSGFPDSRYQRIYNHVDAAVGAALKHG